MDFDTIILPPPILKDTTTSNKQIIFKINDRFNNTYTNDLIHKLKNIHLSSSIKYTVDTNDIKIIGEHDFKNIN